MTTFADLRIGCQFRMAGLTEYIKLDLLHAAASCTGATIPAIVSIDPASEVSFFRDDLGQWKEF